MPQKPVDRPIIMIVGPLLDDSTGKVPQTSIAYTAVTGLDLIVEKHDESSAVTNVAPASGADWVHLARGYYKVALTGGGPTDDNIDTGTARLAGIATGCRPFWSPDYDIIRMHEFDARVSGTTNARIVADTTMTGRTSQTVFRLSAGSLVKDYYVGHRCIIYDGGAPYAVGTGTVTGYDESTKEVTLDALTSTPSFTTANGDVVIIEAIPLSVTVTSPHARTEMDGNSTQLAAIVADTNELQGDWTNGGRLDLIIDEIKSDVDSAIVYLGINDGKVSLILTDTGELQADWTNGGRLDLIIDEIQSDVNAILVDTSGSLVANQIAIKGVVDDILEDTGTTIPGTLSTINITTASTLNDTAFTLPSQISDVGTDVEAIQVQTGKLPTSLTMQVLYDDMITTGTVAASPAPTPTAFAITISPTETTNDHFKDQVVGFTNGPLQGQNAHVLSYDGGTTVLTVTEMTNAPAVGNTIVLLGLVK